MKYLSIKTILKLTLIRVSLCFEGLQGIFLFYFSYFFTGLIKLICEFRHHTFINLRLRHVVYLRPLELFLRKLRFGADKFNQSAACGNTYVPHLPLPPSYLSHRVTFDRGEKAYAVSEDFYATFHKIIRKTVVMEYFRKVLIHRKNSL